MKYLTANSNEDKKLEYKDVWRNKAFKVKEKCKRVSKKLKYKLRKKKMCNECKKNLPLQTNTFLKNTTIHTPFEKVNNVFLMSMKQNQESDKIKHEARKDEHTLQQKDDQEGEIRRNKYKEDVLHSLQKCFPDLFVNETRANSKINLNIKLDTTKDKSSEKSDTIHDPVEKKDTIFSASDSMLDLIDISRCISEQGRKNHNLSTIHSRNDIKTKPHIVDIERRNKIHTPMRTFDLDSSILFNKLYGSDPNDSRLDRVLNVELDERGNFVSVYTTTPTKVNPGVISTVDLSYNDITNATTVRPLQLDENLPIESKNVAQISSNTVRVDNQRRKDKANPPLTTEINDIILDINMLINTLELCELQENENPRFSHTECSILQTEKMLSALDLSN